jgi:Fe-S cluster assembly protein SufD
MNATTATLGFSRDSFESFLAARDEPAWLRDLRAAAFTRFEQLPTPSQQDEEWRRTDIRLLRLDRFGLTPETSGGELPEALLARGVELGGRVAALDSHPHSAQLDAKWATRGVLFGSLDELVREHGELIQPHLFRAVDPQADRFAALHTAFWSGGTLLYVPRGVVVDEPLHAFAALSSGASDLGHTLVVLEEGAQATLLSETASLAANATGFHAGAVELLLAPGSRLRYVNLQNWATGVWHFAHHKGLVASDAAVQWTIAALGSRLAKVNQHVALVGRGADAQVNGVMFTEGKQHLSYHTLQHHEAPHCKSDLLYKAALQDESRTVWRGMIRVDAGAQRTDGYQRNDNLMLSDHARSDSIPGLEILADDVRCTHGSTAGRVDDEQIFYARCRGLTRKEAVRMVVAGFFQQVFDRITIESVREALGEAIGRRIREYE